MAPLSWRALATCKGMDTNLFFDSYENDEEVAKLTDKVCLQCPVRNECLIEGVKNAETGVMGGIYLNRGAYSKAHNKHKDKALSSGLQAQVSAIQKRVVDFD